MKSVGSWRWSMAAAVAAVMVVLVLLAWPANAEINVESCLKICEGSGCAGGSCLPSCRHNENSTRDVVMQKLPVYQRWKKWTCSTECRYHCMLSKETQEAGLEQEAIGYRDNWCLARVMVHQESSKELYTHLAKSAFKPVLDLEKINEPLSAAFSLLNLVGNVLGLVSFLMFVRYHLPRRPATRGPDYPFVGLWTIYGSLVITYWSAQCIIRSRNMAFDRHIDATFEVVLAGYTLILAIIRVGDMRTETARVVVLAPTLAFLWPHLMYINLCTFDYGLNILVCLILGTLQYLLWFIFAIISKHPAQIQLLTIALLGPLSLFLRLYDYSHLWEGLHSDTLWILAAVPSSFLWWNFVKNDAFYLTKVIQKKRKDAVATSKKTQ